MPPINDIILQLDALESKATKGPWSPVRAVSVEDSDHEICFSTKGDGNTYGDNTANNENLVSTLRNSYQELRRYALAGHALMRAIESVHGYPVREQTGRIDAALYAYQESVKEN